MSELRITRPDDWHVHLRDGAALPHSCADVARYFGRAIVMPNLLPPVTTVAAAGAYRERILAAMQGLPRQFEPLLTLYLTDNTGSADIRAAAACDFVQAVKLYPAGSSTHSAAGVTQLEPLYPILELMQTLGLPLLVHGEVSTADTDIFDREAVFIERHLRPLLSALPELKVVLEHITTAAAVDFVRAAGSTVAATITAHHLRYNRNQLLAGAIRPHYYCLPILKRREHQQALLAAATSGNPKFFLGTDSAPHVTADKESDCGCAGCYTAHAAIELYAEAFDKAGALNRLDAFAGHFGPDFYGLPRNSEQLVLRRQDWQIPDSLPLGEQRLTPLCAGQILHWTVVA